MSSEIETARDIEIYARACMEILVALQIKESVDYKIYDPMTIDESSHIAHSYVFDLEDGGRHHPYKSLSELKQQILDETVKNIQEEINFQIACDQTEN